MGKIETLILGAIIAAMVPLTLFLAGWFISAALFLYGVVSIPETAIPIVAFSGLGLGILFDVLCLKRWIRKAYCLNLYLLGLLYLFYAIVTLAFFMGVPIANVGLGVIAGVYVGRRCHHLGAKPKHFQQEVKKVSLFTAWVMSFVAIISGAIAISDLWTPANLQGMFNLRAFTITPAMVVGVVIVGAPLLVVLQYWLAHLAAIVAFRGWRSR